MPLDRIEHATGLLYKIKFYIVYGKMFFLIDSFLSSIRLWVVFEVYDWLSNASEFYHDPYLFSSTLIVSLMMFCVRLLSELLILLSTHHVTNYLTCRNKLRYHMSCNMILKIWKRNTRNIRKCNSAFSHILIFVKLFSIFTS